MDALPSCLLVNYDESSVSLLSRYLDRSGYQTVRLVPGLLELTNDNNPLLTYDLILLHLSSPQETVRDDLAQQLDQHRSLMITSPFPRHQFGDLFTVPIAFLTEPFSYDQFKKHLAACQLIRNNSY